MSYGTKKSKDTAEKSLLVRIENIDKAPLRTQIELRSIIEERRIEKLKKTTDKMLSAKPTQKKPAFGSKLVTKEKPSVRILGYDGSTKTATLVDKNIPDAITIVSSGSGEDIELNKIPPLKDETMTVYAKDWDKDSYEKLASPEDIEHLNKIKENIVEEIQEKVANQIVEEFVNNGTEEMVVDLSDEDEPESE